MASTVETPEVIDEDEQTENFTKIIKKSEDLQAIDDLGNYFLK